ncbi:MAG: tryptophan halogenase family protein [Pseudomonadota bacterium]
MSAAAKNRPFRFLILGGGAAGWMAANLLARAWPERRIEITVLEAPDIGIIGVGEGSTPQLKAFFDRLGVDEATWMPACNATYKNGISFHGWSKAPGCKRYFHPFPSPLDAHTQPAFFFNSYCRRNGADIEAHPDQFFLSARLAQDRLAPLAQETFPFELAYGYHFDAYLVGAFLRDVAKAAGVRHVEAKATEAALTESGDVAALRLDNGEMATADFFIDASGFRSVILQQALGERFNSYAENLFNDAAVALPSAPDADSIASETQAVAMKNGWRWRIPLTNRYGNGYVYASGYCSADEAETELRRELGLLDADVEARHLKMNVGVVERHWVKNCLAVGLSQGFIEPLEATALHLVQATIEGFIEAFEGGRFTPQKRDAFNADISARFEGVRDYIVCHYRVNKRTDTAYWRDNAANENLSPTLRGVLEHWFAGGDMREEIAKRDIGKYYTAMSWNCLLGGYGVYPPAERLSPPGQELKRFDLATINDFIRRCAMNYPDHKEALASR